MTGSDASPEISPAAPALQTQSLTVADSAAPESEAVPETVEAAAAPPPRTPPAPESESPTAEELAAPESVEAAEATEPETAPVAEPEAPESVEAAEASEPETAPVAPESVEAAEVTESDTAPAAASVAEDAAAAAPVASSEVQEIPIAADSLDNKRKLEDLVDGEAASKSAEKAPESVSLLPGVSADPTTPTKRQRLDGESAVAGDEEMQKIETPVVANGQPSVVDNDPVPNNSFYQQGSVTYEQQKASSETTSRKFEIPNNKVGVLIGKSGETIRVLQENSGAKIQITRDNEADPNSSYRPVELIGTLECINKAEQLIKDVIAAAEAGGSPALVARGFGYGQSGSEQHEMQVPNDKVGLVIGRGGETIKNLQIRSGARIQLVPPEGESANDKIVRLTGNKKQIEDAKEMIKEVMNQAPVKRAHSSGGYNQQSFRPRGPSFGSQWGTRMPAPAQQRGMYPPQSSQYPPQSYGSYTQQHIPPRNTSTAWDPRAGVPIQTAEYNNYYGQGGQGSNNQSIPAAAPSQAPVNYNYGPSQSVGYGQQAPYVQSAQQSYNPGFNEQNYDGQARGQYYGQKPVNSQPGAYPQQGGVQMDYPQQQSYGPRPQSTDPMYQGSVQTSYGAAEATQPSYYGQTAPTQPAPVYGQAYSQTPGTTDGYAQPSPAAGYPQQSSQVAPGYAQGGQPAPTYTQQVVQSGGYVQYPSQQGYGDQSAQNNVNYGYGGNNIPGSGYGPSPVSNQAGYGQTGYPQQQTHPTGYQPQSVPPQSGYGS